MHARAIDSSPVIDQRGELLGTLSKNKMNRNVGGWGHDPKTEPVEAHIEENNAYCFEDQTIAEAEQMMLSAKIGEVLVVTREKLLVGMIYIEAIAQKKKMEKTLGTPEIPRLRFYGGDKRDDDRVPVEFATKRRSRIIQSNI